MLIGYTISELVIPDKLKAKAHNTQNNIIAFEGVDGCGKTSLCSCLEETFPEFSFAKIPEAYVEMPFKNYLSSEASPMASTLIYSASLVERKVSADALMDNRKIAVMDRSLWSTVALKWVDNPQFAQNTIDLFENLADCIPVPALMFVLDVPYEICRKRIQERDTITRKFDKMSREQYERHMDFYRWLSLQDVGLRMIKPESKNLQELAEEIRDIAFSFLGEMSNEKRNH